MIMRISSARSLNAETLAELLEQLGDVPPERVRLVPVPGTATEKHVLDMERRYNRLFELVDGTLVEKAMGFRESFLAAAIIRILGEFVKRGKRGVVVGADGMMRLSAGLVRMPDVAFVSWDRLPGRRIPRRPIPRLGPNLAIEVLSASNRPREMARKRREYFAAGAIRVWEVGPVAPTVSVYSDPDTCRIYDATQIIDASPALPGFRLNLAELFGELDETADE
jgi:Uma2 family endonuclease